MFVDLLRPRERKPLIAPFMLKWIDLAAFNAGASGPLGQ